MRIFLSFILATCCITGFSQSLPQQIQKAYTTFEQDSQLKYASSSLTVLNASTGEVIFTKNDKVGLAPASALKTVTSATAYNLLGKDFTYQTTLGYSGATDAMGTLHGDLVITGGGDPTLGSWRYTQTKEGFILNKWVAAIKAAGIKTINGRIIGDDRLFGTESAPERWLWQDIGNYWGAGPSALSWRENKFDLVFRSGNKVGDLTAFVRTEPQMPFLKIVNEVTTGSAGSGDNVYAFSAPYSDIVYLRGTYGIDLNKLVSASVPDPAFDAAFRLQDTLQRLGLSSLQATTYRRLAADKITFSLPVKTIAVQTSPNLDQIIYWLNLKSVNLYAEHLIKTLALKNGNSTTTEKGVEVIRNFWSDKLGIDKNEMNILDGSGLSPETRITTLAMAKILQSTKKESWFKSYLESFPEYNGMKMKSGTIRDGLAYAGFHTSSAGVPLVFSFIVNIYSGGTSATRQKMFKMLDALK